MSSSDSGAAWRPGPRAGFTLTEMMVALVMAGVLTTALWELMRAQARFAATESQRQEAQANGRTALDVLAGDLRAALPEGIVTAGEGVLVMALPRAWGVLCAASTPTRITVAFPSVPGDAFTVLAYGGTGVMVNTAEEGEPRWLPRPALDDSRAAVTTLVSADAAAACPTAAGNVRAWTLTGTRFPSAEAGAAVALYQLVRYDLGESEGKWWVRRSNGLSGPAGFSMAPLAGPVAAGDGLRFTWYAGPQADEARPAPGSAADALGRLSRVKVRVVTLSSGAYGGAASVNRDSATLALRNRARPLACADPGAGPC